MVGDVGVAFDKARVYDAAASIDRPRGIDLRHDLPGRTDRGNIPSGDRDRAIGKNPPVFVHRDDVAIYEDKINVEVRDATVVALAHDSLPPRLSAAAPFGPAPPGQTSRL